MLGRSVTLAPGQSVVSFGVDPGLTAGYGVVRWDGRTVVSLAYGAIPTTPAQGEVDARVAHIIERLRIVSNLYAPDGVAVEGWAFYRDRSPKDAFAVGLVAGASMAGLGAPGIIVGTAPEWHQMIGLPASIDKLGIQKHIQRVLRMPELPRPTHAADALGIAIAALPRIAAMAQARSKANTSR